MEQVAPESWPVEVVFAGPRRQTLMRLRVSPGTTLRAAIEQSGILDRIPSLDLSTAAVGVYGRLRSLDTEARAGERIEIYRPLQLDPKAARRARAAGKEARSR